MQQQRQLRLGDTLDDYCTRERRLSNHTIVAMVGDEIRMTRCTTCDAEHPYKGGKVPRQRSREKKTSIKAAYDEVLDSVKKDGDSPGTLVNHSETQPAGTAPAAPNDGAGGNRTPADPLPEATPPQEETRLHRPLIRASLPRLEAQPPARPIPEFTIRQANRHGKFQNSRGRFAKGRVGANTAPHGNSRGPGTPQGARHSGRPQGSGSHMRPGPGRHPGQHQGPGKKRSR